MNRLFRPNSAIDETQATTKKRNLFAIAIVCLLVYMLGSIASSFIATIPTYSAILEDEEAMSVLSQENVDRQAVSEALDAALNRVADDNPTWFRLVNLFSTIGVIIVVFCFCLMVEKRRLFTIGLAKNNALGEYASGLLIGFLMFSLVYGIGLISGEISFVGVNHSISVKTLLLFLLAFLIQGASEEIMLRGFVFTTVSANIGTPTGILINSFLFAWLHLGNSGISLLAFINLFLFGIFASLYFLRRGSVWGICAIHSVWNFAQGNIYGLNVSGNALDETLFFTSQNAKNLISGGDFGPEGGLAVTIVFLIGIIVLLPMKNKNIEGFFARRCREFI